MPPTFFLEVKQNQTTPFWLHPILQPNSLVAPTLVLKSGMIEPNGTMLDEEEGGDGEVDDDDEEWIDMEAGNAIKDHQTMHE